MNLVICRCRMNLTVDLSCKILQRKRFFFNSLEVFNPDIAKFLMVNEMQTPNI